MPHTSLLLFLLGLACGVALWATSAFRRVTPWWLRGLLIASGFFMVSRYVAIAVFASAETPEQVWWMRHCWFATSLGLPLASAVAVDQVVRHPAMTPKKLLTWLAPFLIIYLTIILFGTMTLVPDRVVGWTIHLSHGWQMLLASTQATFVVGFLATSLILFRKIPSPRIRRILLCLMGGQVLLACEGVFLALGVWDVRPYLYYSEPLVLLAIWYALETAMSLRDA